MRGDGLQGGAECVTHARHFDRARRDLRGGDIELVRLGLDLVRELLADAFEQMRRGRHEPVERAPA